MRDSTAVPAAMDTSVYFALTVFGEDYDWIRDTAYSSSTYSIVLYKNFDPILSLHSGESTCISPDADFQHLIGGHLYTERADASHTAIGKDGTELVRFAGRERLYGLVEKGGRLHTLSRNISGGQYSYRIDGELMLSIPDCTVFGSFDDTSYLPHGALYEDNGEICFCYLRSDGTYTGRDYRIVCDGRDSPTGYKYGTFSDIKRCDGEFRGIGGTLGIYRVSDGRVWRGGRRTFSGKFAKPSMPESYGLLLDGEDGEFVDLGAGEQWIYHSGEVDFGISPDSGPRLMHKDCASASGALKLIGASPRDNREKPRIIMGGRVTEIDAHGYISAVEAVISPAS